MTVDNATPPTTSEKELGDSSRQGISRRSRWSIVLMAIGLIAIVATLNWPFQFASVAGVPIGELKSSADYERIQLSMPVMAGWPYRYLIRFAESDSGAPGTVRFSPWALAYNLAISGLVLLCVMFYLIRRDLKNASRASRVSIADLLVLTLVLAAPFGWWQQAGRRLEVENSLATELRDAGGVYMMSAWIPAVLEPYYPASLTAKLRRLHEVRIEYPSKELMSRLVDLRELTMLRVGGGDYDLALVGRLVANPHLADLRLAGRVIDAPTMQSIAAHKRLHTLNLMRTNVSFEALQTLDQLPDLQRLCLIHSDVVLSELGTPGWSRTIRQLSIAHPDPGDEASVRIEGWPKLEELAINELESQLNTTSMSVELVDLPELKHVYLDVFQKFDLTFRDLPKLESITPLDFEWRSRLARGGSAPGTVWCGRIDMDGVPALKAMNFFSLGLKYFRIRNAPKLEALGVAAFFKTQSGSTYAPELTSEAATALISGLGEGNGPATIDLDAVPLANVDLAPLAKNKGITQLLMSQSNSTLKQWKSLEPMKWLVRLDIKDCPIDGDGIQWILDAFPNLEHFAFTPGPKWTGDNYREGTSVLEFVDRPNLRTLDLGDSSTELFSTVRVINSPNLTAALALGYVQTLEISGAPSLTGLRVSGPVPADARIEGVRDLQFCAVGGPTVNDEFIAPLQNCNSLITLTLAYPAVTADGLKRLTNIASVQSLSLPGAPVDDTVVAQWPELTKLTQLDLRDTSITGASLKRLMASRTATRVLLDRTKVSKSELSIIAEQPSLNELSLAGVGIDAKSLSSILANCSLQRLNLSNSDVTPEILDVIASGARKLTYLVLRDCELDDKKLRTIATQNSSLRFDLTGSNVSTQLMTALLAAHRIVDMDEWDQQVAMQAMISSMNQGADAETVDPAQIDIRYFAQLAQQSDPAGVPTQIGPLIGGAPPASFGTRLGQWFGRALLGAKPTVTVDDNAEEPSSDESETASPDVDVGDTEQESSPRGENEGVIDE